MNQTASDAAGRAAVEVEEEEKEEEEKEQEEEQKKEAKFQKHLRSKVDKIAVIASVS